MQSRFKSKVAWSSLLCLIVLILKDFFGVELDSSDKIIELLLAILAGFGVFNNPENKKGF